MFKERSLQNLESLLPRCHTFLGASEAKQQSLTGDLPVEHPVTTIWGQGRLLLTAGRRARVYRALPQDTKGACSYRCKGTQALGQATR